MPLAVIPLGLVIGLALGTLGGGGSILAVPALVHLLGQDPVAATTSSLVIVGITSLLSIPAHQRAGRVRLGQGVTFGLLGTAGSFAGSAAARAVPAAVLMTAFAVLMLVVATLMLRQSLRGESESAEAGTSEPIITLRPLACACPRLVKLVVAATVVGLLTGFLGVGGGFVLVPALVLVLGFTMPVAVGTSLLVIAINSATALAARVQHGIGDLDWPLIVGFSAAAVVGSLVGSKVADRLPEHRLSQAFAVLVLVIAGITAVQYVPDLVA
ncbi:sulfite exporter TauE/SafE family protein [Janibacter cremeus]|uniref:sulfite exporter TauE/SafE family protein n=1 Tax=Janibacter cremeus TaxID=1285192 RepID=UPI0023F866FB|nr:sulfite exporter TauE/SafE family protein [Janibacter cremeus]WEV77296.1 sulfite exporter TauE/SafE family protein [Janibacter cremeus]